MHRRGLLILALLLAIDLAAVVVALRSAPDVVATVGVWHAHSAARIVDAPPVEGVDARSATAESHGQASSVAAELVAPAREPATAVAQPEAALRVVVVDPDGGPIAGVEAYVRRGKLGGPLEIQRTDAAGGAAFAHGGDGDWLILRAQGFVPVDLELSNLPWTKPRTIELARASPWLEGLLVDDLGKPIDGASLVLRAGASKGIMGVETYRTRTDTRGAFAFHGRHEGPPLEARFTVEGDEHRSPADGASLTWAAWRERGWPTLVAERRASLVLTVERASGRATRSAAVVVTGGGGLRLHGEPDLFQRKTTLEGTDGRPCYLLRPPAGTPLWIEAALGHDHAWTGGRAALEHARVELGKLAPGERVERTLRLEDVPDPFVTILVRDGRGRPIEGARVAISFLDGRSTIEEEAGLLRTRLGRPFGPWSLTVRAKGYEPAERSMDAGWASDAPIEVVLQQLSTSANGGVASDAIEVLVVDEAGAPVPGASVMLRGPDQYHPGTTGADGRFAQAGLEALHHYRVSLGSGRPGAYGLADPLLVPEPQTYGGVRPGGEPLLFRLQRGGSIEGLLPIVIPPRTRVVLSCLGERAGRGSSFRIGQALASDGRFEFSGLPTGRYLVEALTFGEPVAVPVELDLARGERVEVELVPR